MNRKGCGLQPIPTRLSPKHVTVPPPRFGAIFFKPGPARMRHDPSRKPYSLFWDSTVSLIISTACMINVNHANPTTDSPSSPLFLPLGNRRACFLLSNPPRPQKKPIKTHQTSTTPNPKLGPVPSRIEAWIAWRSNGRTRCHPSTTPTPCPGRRRSPARGRAAAAAGCERAG